MVYVKENTSFCFTQRILSGMILQLKRARKKKAQNVGFSIILNQENRYKARWEKEMIWEITKAKACLHYTGY